MAVVELATDLSSGMIVDQLTGNFDVPTTVARFGSSLYVVNARFGRRQPPVPVLGDATGSVGQAAGAARQTASGSLYSPYTPRRTPHISPMVA